MSALHVLAVLAAGLAAGTVNAIVGSGSLITYPTLIALGLPPLLANVSNTVGLVPGVLSGSHAYRRELTGQTRRLLTLCAVATAGGATGSGLLLALPGSVFKRVVPVLILLACVLVAIQPKVAEWLRSRGERNPHGGVGLYLGVFATAIYGGYFGAAQGVILIALLGIFIEDSLQRLNAAKTVIAAATNGIAALIFIALTRIDWEVAGLIALSSIVGGQIGGNLGRRIRPGPLRVAIVCVGVGVAIALLV